MIDVPGWDKLITWFGSPPNFHDAEIQSLDLRRSPELSRMQIHAWRLLDETGADGFLKTDRHALVTFIFSGTTRMHIDGWNHQNVILHLTITRDSDDYVMAIETSHGLEGEIAMRDLRVEIEPLSNR
jgi:hypothetical protein